MARQTDRFYETIRKSHQIVSYVDVIGADREVVRLPAINGQVDVDSTAAFRRKLSVACIDPTGKLTPRTQGELLTPYGTELRAYRGVQYSRDPEDVEVAPLGVFRLSRASISDSNGGSPDITLEAYDKSRTISRDKFKVPYVITAGTNCLTAIRQIIQQTFTDAVYDSVSTAVTTTGPLLYDAGSDPWQAVTVLAQSMGCQIYYDVEGRVAILPPHNVNALPSPDFSYNEGEGCSLVDLTREYSDENAYNGVIVTGEAIGDNLPPVRGEAWDENPKSPTYRKGPYGEVPKFITDNLAKTEDQAVAIARSVLARTLGASSKLGITGIVNPSYECNDIIQVKRKRSGVDGLYALDAFSVPLRSGTQTLSLREQRPAQ